ncbi:MAG: 5-formyltetrahydrofolate cyclo-ligase [Solobacterium sp.]|nr:5-formyltetrahydrofolate cyclo-ligase [Solobacterium sp.]MCH4048095.1 5-formyltetrahydrofolate cyclo-ligase [Solobacterium sp.]MCH4075051.1 5-formyltetrahydrofolate cyclo-ligase [Solobacterium sp.]MCI1314339.1 5-formyltetrahydrofolate cyclo-ligase [Solobacterium sp.]MCI1408208.1 5-formyltetrahydrofolate cyclo-ligase [Solobacterium sp.]
MDKKEARRAGLAARTALSASCRKQYSHRIFLKLKGRLDHVSSIGIYVSIQNEVETEEIIQYCFDSGIHVHVPKVEGKNIHFYEIHAFSDLIPGVWSIPEPDGTEPETDPSSIDWMLVPLSAFDAAHHRTGYGAGYYDRILPYCRHKTGIAFSVQEVDDIETDPWDEDLDEIITEQ